MADVSSKVQYLGNPAKAYSDANGRGWTYARNPWDLYAHSGVLYIGCGNSGSPPDQNAGPVPILSYNPSSGFASAGTSGGTIPQEQIEKFRSIDGVLTIPGHDPRSGSTNPLYIYRLPGSSWTQVNADSTSTSPLPANNSAVHAYDVAKLGSSYFTAVSPNAVANSVFTATSMTSTAWAGTGGTFGGFGTRCYWLETFGGVLYGFLDTAPSTGFNRVGKCSSGTSFSVVSSSTFESLFPSSSTGEGGYRVARAVVFGSSFVYLAGKIDAGPQWLPRELYAATALDPISTAVKTLPNGAACYDLLVDGSTLYALGAHTSGSDTVVGVYRTTDLVSWSEVFTLKPINVTGAGYTGAQTFARSFEKIGSVWYFGLGSNNAGTQPANVGAILAYTPPWAMAAGNPQRTAYQPESLGPSWSLAWRAQQHIEYSASQIRDKTHGQTSVVVSAGNVILPNMDGRVRSYAASATKGLRWTATVGAPIIASPAADMNNVYVADCYGRVSAFKLSDGTAASGWTNPVQVTDHGEPIQSHLLLADGLLMFGGGDGKFRFLNPANGAVTLPAYDVGVPILQGAAADEAGKVVVGCMDGYVRCFSTSTGGLLWTSPAIAGVASFKDYWPVIVGSKVVIRPQSQYPETGNYTSTSPPLRSIEVSDWQSDSSMTTALASYAANPSNYRLSLVVLNLADGTLASQQLVHWHFQATMHGSPPPVCVDRDGYVIQPVKSPPSFYAHASVWGRSSLTTGKVVSGLLEGAVLRGLGNPDENLCVSACANGVFSAHIQEGNAHDTGFFNLDTSTWTLTEYGAGAGNMLYANIQGGGANPAAISGGMVYHNCHPHTLVAMRSS